MDVGAMVAAKERVTLDIEVSAELRERLDGGRTLSREAVESMRSLKREIFKGGKLPGNSADIIREEREKRAKRIDRARLPA